jgi:hypothetical protein
VRLRDVNSCIRQPVPRSQLIQRLHQQPTHLGGEFGNATLIHRDGRDSRELLYRLRLHRQLRLSAATLLV